MLALLSRAKDEQRSALHVSDRAVGSDLHGLSRIETVRLYLSARQEPALRFMLGAMPSVRECERKFQVARSCARRLRSRYERLPNLGPSRSTIRASIRSL